ncbi:hypothetical protein [Nocardioides terrigena]|uniref:hypothetical protein n=1 Tax=Nocardioides terrigena TaxID=424797 RepID=UPI000D32151B|nr:hypothetical protein [Nocardioides terrigena]
MSEMSISDGSPGEERVDARHQIELVREQVRHEVTSRDPATRHLGAPVGDRIEPGADFRFTDDEMETLRASVPARLRKHRADRDRDLKVAELVGARDTDSVRAALDTLTALDMQVDDVWASWLAQDPENRLPGDWDRRVDDVHATQERATRRQAQRDRFSLVALAIALASLVLCFQWIVVWDGSGAAYLSAWASAVAGSFIANHRLRGRMSAERLWSITLLPPLVLTVALSVWMLRDELRSANDEIWLAATVLLVLALLILAVTLDGRRPVRRFATRRRVDLPADLEDPEYAKRLGDYLEELRVAVLNESFAKVDSARLWQRWFIILGASAALLSAGAGVTGLSGQVAELAAISALVGAGLSATVTLLNPAGQAQQASQVGASCGSLAEEIDVLIRIDLPHTLRSSGSLAEVRDHVETISTRFDELREVPQRPRLWKGNTAPAGQDE